MPLWGRMWWMMPPMNRYRDNKEVSSSVWSLVNTWVRNPAGRRQPIHGDSPLPACITSLTRMWAGWSHGMRDSGPLWWLGGLLPPAGKKGCQETRLTEARAESPTEGPPWGRCVPRWGHAASTSLLPEERQGEQRLHSPPPTDLPPPAPRWRPSRTSENRAPSAWSTSWTRNRVEQKEQSGGGGEEAQGHMTRDSSFEGVLPGSAVNGIPVCNMS